VFGEGGFEVEESGVKMAQRERERERERERGFRQKLKEKCWWNDVIKH
jgi:hypothetical protein